MGLVTLHAYAIIKADMVNGKYGQAKVMKIRNPWGE
jgi:hypothetical protein